MKELKELAARHGMIATEVDEDGHKKYLIMIPTYNNEDNDIPSGFNFQLFKNKEGAVEYINNTPDNEITTKSIEWVKKYSNFMKGNFE